jgi:hypothetical protein
MMASRTGDVHVAAEDLVEEQGAAEGYLGVINLTVIVEISVPNGLWLWKAVLIIGSVSRAEWIPSLGCENRQKQGAAGLEGGRAEVPIIFHDK